MSSNDNSGSNEMPKPGAVSVVGAAPQGKPSRKSSSGAFLVKNQPPDALAGSGTTTTEMGQEGKNEEETQSVVLAQLQNSNSNLQPMEPEALLEPNRNGGNNDTNVVDPAAGGSADVALSASAVARSSRRNESKAAIRQEMDTLRSQGLLPQGPGAVSVTSTSDAPPPNSKAAIKREIKDLKAALADGRNKEEENDPASHDQPGAHSVTANDQASAAASWKGVGASSRSERPRRRGLKDSATDQSTLLTSSSVTSSTVTTPSQQQPGALPSTTESTIATKMALIFKTDDVQSSGAVEEAATTTTIPSDVIKKPLDDGGNLEDDGSAGGSGMMDAEGGFVAAQAIDENELEAQYQAKMLKSVVAAEIVSEDELKERGRCWKMTCCCILVIGIIVAVAVPLSKSNDASTITMAPTVSPTEQPEYDYLVDLFSPYAGDALFDNTTASYKALNWIAFEDPLDLPIKESNQTTLVERFAAAVLYYSTAGEQWEDDLGFMSNTSICEWNAGFFGIVCDEETNQYAVRIDLESNNMNGTIPSELLGFSKLDTLNIGYGLYGTLPSELGYMTALTALQIYGNSITGTIPSTYTQPEFVVFNLFGNQLTGSLPADIFREKHTIEYIIVTQNQLTGPLPEIRKESSILYMDYEVNFFEGTIPHVYFEQKGLTYLFLSDNFFTGTIPEQIRALKRLAFFYAARNTFTGTIPSDFTTLRDLEEYMVMENMFSGSIPTGFGGLDLLTKLSIASNKLTGSLPSELANMATIISFNVSSNPLTGTVPSSFLQMTSLADFDLSGTNIVGGLEETFCSQSLVSTSISADCLGNSSSSITCTCCSTCCNDETCEINFMSMCEAKSAEFALAPDRGTTCDCQDGGTTLSCTDSACESCNLDGSVCAVNTDYGYTFDEVTGRKVSFQNVIQYTKGRNETLVFSSKPLDNFCVLEVNGERCQTCMGLLCASSKLGFQIDCSNLPGGGPNFESCGDPYDVGYLEIFYLIDLASLSGCPPILINLQPNA